MALFRAQSGQSVPIHGLDLPALCMVTSARGLEDAAVSVINVRTQHLGPEELLVGAKVEFQPGLSTAEIAAAVDAVEAAVRAAVGEVAAAVRVSNSRR